MSEQYNKYLKEHRENVWRACDKLLTEVLGVEWFMYHNIEYGLHSELHNNVENHDKSKYELFEEYMPYDNYFYGERNDEVEERFAYAWLHHIHKNPHHWQHWILNNDDGTTKILDMPVVYIVEMICDWWAFSLKQNKPLEIISFYEKNKNNMMLSDKTRLIVESILDKIERRYKNDIC